MRKSKLAAIFNWLITVLSAITVVSIVVIWYAGVTVEDGTGVGYAMAAAIVLVFGLYAAIFGVPLGFSFGLPKAILFSVSAKKGKRLSAKYVLATFEKLVWTVIFVFAAIFSFDFGTWFGVVIGSISVTMAVLNVASYVFDWMTLSDFKKKKEETPVAAIPVEEELPEEESV